MPNPHPFYRFSSGWNNGFYPQNQITTNQLNDIYVALGAWIPGYFPGKTIDEFYAGVRAFIATYNEFPILGNFTSSITKILDPPNNSEYNINIRDLSLLEIDDSQVLTINGFYNPSTKLVLNASLDSFTPGSYSGIFYPPHVPAEDDGINALQIANNYGSAIFPLYYSYDSTLGIAASVLARASSYQLSSGAITRLPADTMPQQNARRFTLAALSSEDKFAITFLERIINASIGQSDATAIAYAYNSLEMPDGWTKGYSYNPTTYPRVQVTLSSSSGRVFAILGRLDGSWMWQRFINEIGENDNSILINSYSATTTLPYEPTSGSRYVYFDTWYDFDFCDFTSDCYVSPEFYPMPAIPGDIWQFNVPIDSGNLTGLSSCTVGLFTQEGQFVQQIGQSNIALIVTVGYGMWGYFDIQYSYADWYDDFYNPDFTVNFQMTDCDGNVIGDVLAFIPVNGLSSGDFSEFKSVVEGLAWPDYLSVEVELDNEGKVVFTYTLTSTPICFCSITAWTLYEGSGETVYFIRPEIYQQAAIPTQFYSTCTIPAVKDGCYRLGLYSQTEEAGWYLYSLSNIINIDRADCFSTMLEFWSDDNTMAQGFEYFNGWKQQVRLGINGGGAKPIIEENLYRQSNGVHKRPQNKQDLSLDLHTDFLDEETQLALVDATRHPYLVWNQKPIFVKGDIDVATIQDFTTQSSFETLAQVKFQALLQGFQPRNSSCLTC
jgi:hypothetical protein